MRPSLIGYAWVMSKKTFINCLLGLGLGDVWPSLIAQA